MFKCFNTFTEYFKLIHITFFFKSFRLYLIHIKKKLEKYVIPIKMGITVS